MRLIAALATIALLGARASAQDFSELTSLAEGAVVGIGVDQPVEGFEIVVLKDGQPLYHQAFGNWTLGQVASADSATKTLSGALVMAVAESGDGGFSLESRLADFLPEYNKPGYSDITVRQAFSHTSGLPGDDVSSLILTAPNITLRQAGFLVSQQPLENGPPGSTFAYGGLSMQAVGAAMEVATGETYIDLFADRIATPLGLSDTRFYIASDTNPRVAGGIETTAIDVARFTDMLLNGGVDRATGIRVLSAASVEEMVTRQTTDAQPIANSPTDNNRYGIGVWIDQLGMAGPTVDYLAAGAAGCTPGSMKRTAWCSRSPPTKPRSATLMSCRHKCTARSWRRSSPRAISTTTAASMRRTTRCGATDSARPPTRCQTTSTAEWSALRSTRPGRPTTAEPQ